MIMRNMRNSGNDKESGNESEKGSERGREKGKKINKKNDKNKRVVKWILVHRNKGTFFIRIVADLTRIKRRNSTNSVTGLMRRSISIRSIGIVSVMSIWAMKIANKSGLRSTSGTLEIEI